jgi:hypothetical protein
MLGQMLYLQPQPHPCFKVLTESFRSKEHIYNVLSNYSEKNYCVHMKRYSANVSTVGGEIQGKVPRVLCTILAAFL